MCVCVWVFISDCVIDRGVKFISNVTFLVFEFGRWQTRNLNAESIYTYINIYVQKWAIGQYADVLSQIITYWTCSVFRNIRILHVINPISKWIYKTVAFSECSMACIPGDWHEMYAGILPLYMIFESFD